MDSKQNNSLKRTKYNIDNKKLEKKLIHHYSLIQNLVHSPFCDFSVVIMLIYACPMKMHHSSNVLGLGLLNIVH